MKWFKRRKKNRELPQFLAKRLLYFDGKLRVLADLLQKRMVRCSLATQKIWLASFCLLFLTASVCAVIDAVRTKGRAMLPIKRISVMRLAEDTPSLSRVSIVELQKIHRFKVYLDSVSIKTRDSLLSGRPHLLDTLNFLETLYQNEIKMKKYDQ